MRGWAGLSPRGDGAALRFERVLAHPPEKVFRAVSDPAELRHWFPADVQWELRAGAPIRFSFEEGDDDTPGGEVLAVDPPRLLRFAWGDDVLSFEIAPEGAGSRLVFTHALAPGGSSGGLPGAARNAAGWDVCLASLTARLDGAPAPAPAPAWFPLFEAYVERFGLGEGEVEGDVVRFARDVPQPPGEVWELLAGGTAPAPGEPAPRRFGPAPPGTVAAVEPERALAYAREDGALVRWTLEQRVPGTLVVVEQPVPADGVPALLAAWQVHLELLVAALAGVERCWPEDRLAVLEARCTARLAAA